MHRILLLMLALQQPPQAAPNPSQARAAAPEIEWSELPHDLPQSLRDSVRFGYLAVPEDHTNPNGPRIRIAIAVLRARSATPEPDPVVSIAGGPGLPAIESHMRLRAAGPHPLDVFRERRDLVIVDARGHGYSGPARCSELDGREPITEDSPVAEQLWLERLAACRDRLAAKGVRLDKLSSVQSAHDLEQLRQALGAPQLNLIGLSYGTRIVAEAVRQVPGAIRAVYFSGPVPAGHFSPGNKNDVAKEVLGTLFERCAAQPECGAEYPRLQADHDSVLARLRRAPLRVPVPLSAAVPEGHVTVDDNLMRHGLAQLLINRDVAAGAPLLIHTLAERGLGQLGSMAPQLMRSQEGDAVAAGTFLAFWCNDGVVTSASSEPLRERCRVWLGEAWEGRLAERVASDMPALIETGELDPRTPPSYARFLAAGLPRAHLLIAPWYGHERPADCTLRLARNFIDAPDALLDTACLDSIPPIRFVTGVVPSRWVGKAFTRTATRPWFAAFPTAAALLLLVPAVGIPVREIRARRRGHRLSGRVATRGLLLVAAVGLFFLVGLAVALTVSMRHHFLIPMIGLPKEWAWLLALPWLLLVLTSLQVFLVLRGGRGGTDEPPAVLRWATLSGAVLLLTFWCSSLLG